MSEERTNQAQHPAQPGLALVSVVLIDTYPTSDWTALLCLSCLLLPHSHQAAISATFSSSCTGWAPPGRLWLEFVIENLQRE